MAPVLAINDPTVGTNPPLAVLAEIDKLEGMQGAQFGQNAGAIFQKDNLR